MKKITIFLFVELAFVLTSIAQNEYFNGDPKWGIHLECQPWPTWGTKTIYDANGDTLLNGEVFLKFYESGISYSNFNNYSESIYVNPIPIALLRSEGQRVYKWNDAVSDEELLYNFDVVVGDIFEVHADIFPVPMYVQSINNTTLGSSQRKVISLATSMEEPALEVIEGVGHIRGLWAPFEENFDCNYWLECYSIDGVTYDVDMFDSPWLLLTEGNCEYSLGTSELASSLFKLYPNPVTHDLIIKSYSLSSIAIVNSLGESVFNKEKINPIEIIDFSSFGSGLYFCHGFDSNDHIHRWVFLKI